MEYKNKSSKIKVIIFVLDKVSTQTLENNKKDLHSR